MKGPQTKLALTPEASFDIYIKKLKKKLSPEPLKEQFDALETKEEKDYIADRYAEITQLLLKLNIPKEVIGLVPLSSWGQFKRGLVEVNQLSQGAGKTVNAIEQVALKNAGNHIGEIFEDIELVDLMKDRDARKEQAEELFEKILHAHEPLVLFADVALEHFSGNEESAKSNPFFLDPFATPGHKKNKGNK